MSEPIDVGSVLGGRYKVTGRILATAENDVVLDGLDQILNRPVSILVASPESSPNLAQSAREVATGQRSSSVSVLDLATTESGESYLIASRCTPADLLDLVVPTEAVEEVYQEPFYTDTLGTEIFGSTRDTAADGYVYEDNSPLTPAAPVPPVAGSNQGGRNQAGAAAAGAAAGWGATQAVPATPAPNQPGVPRIIDASQTPVPDASEPKVSLWSDEDYGFVNEHQDPAQPQRPAAAFPAQALEDYDPEDDYIEEDYEDEEDDAPRKSGRWLTGIIITVLVVGALVFALSHIGSLLNGTPIAGGTSNSPAASAGKTTAAPKPQTSAPAPVTVPPAIAKVTDITTYGGAQKYNEVFLPRLKDLTDGNKATYWPTVEFSDATFASLTESIDLAVELKQESTISSLSINQIGGTGGQFSVLTNSKPSLEGAKKIGSGSFTAPEFTVKFAGNPKGKYVIISFTQMPKLQPFSTYPYGMKVAEIAVK